MNCTKNTWTSPQRLSNLIALFLDEETKAQDIFITFSNLLRYKESKNTHVIIISSQTPNPVFFLLIIFLRSNMEYLLKIYS